MLLMSRSVSLIATLIANPAKALLAPSLGIKASAAVNATGLYWLADGIACDIPLASGISTKKQKTLCALLSMVHPSMWWCRNRIADARKF